MYLVLILSEQGVPYLHTTIFVDCASAAACARALSCRYPSAVVRVFALTLRLAVAHFKGGLVV